jgi:hypothetical protein
MGLGFGFNLWGLAWQQGAGCVFYQPFDFADGSEVYGGTFDDVSAFSADSFLEINDGVLKGTGTGSDGGETVARGTLNEQTGPLATVMFDIASDLRGYWGVQSVAVYGEDDTPVCSFTMFRWQGVVTIYVQIKGSISVAEVYASSPSVALGVQIPDLLPTMTWKMQINLTTKEVNLVCSGLDLEENINIPIDDGLTATAIKSVECNLSESEAGSPNTLFDNIRVYEGIV